MYPTTSPTHKPTGSPTRAPTHSPYLGCTPNIVNDLLIMVDISASMNETALQSIMIDMVVHMGLQIGFGTDSRIGFGTFSSTADTRIVVPLQTWPTFQSWDTRVRQEMATMSLKCCTPHAESLEVAQTHFREMYMEDHSKTLIVLTDGGPFQNKGDEKWDYGGTDAVDYNNPNRIDRCEYNAITVPAAAASLKADGVRIVMSGVLNNKDKVLGETYFGGGKAGKWCCVNHVSGKKKDCNKQQNCNIDFDEDHSCHQYSSEPIVTNPEHDLVVGVNWDINDLNAGIEGLICDGEALAAHPTPPPTTFVAPTTGPTFA